MIRLTPLEREIGHALGVPPRSVRFYGDRLLIELILGRRLTEEEQRYLYNHAPGAILDLRWLRRSS